MARSALGTAMEETKAVGEMARNFLRQEACSGHGKKRVQSAATQTRRKRELHCSKGRPCKEYVREEARKRSCTAVLEEEGSVVERVDSFPREEACSGHGKKRARRVMTRTRRKRGLHLPKGVMQGARPRGGKKACPAQMRRKRGVSAFDEQSGLIFGLRRRLLADAARSAHGHGPRAVDRVYGCRLRGSQATFKMTDE